MKDLQYGLAAAFAKQSALWIAFGFVRGSALAFGYYAIGWLIGGDD